MNIIEKIVTYSQNRVKDFKAQYKAFGYYVVLQYPLSYMILSSLGSQINENPIIRAIAVLLAFPLIVYKRWPSRLQSYLPLYWHFNVMFSTPLFCTYMLFANKFTMAWLMNVALGFFTIVLLVDWITFVILLNIGVLLGLLSYGMLHHNFAFDLSLSHMTLALYMYGYAIFIGLVFSRNKDVFTKEKLITAQSLSGMIAHETGTPLASLFQNVQALKSIFPVPSEHSEQANRLFIRMDYQFHRINWIIQNLLNNIKDIHRTFTRQTVLISHLIEQSLTEYPFQPGDENLVHVDIQQDFYISTDVNLFTHALSNLIKNALYAIQKKEAGNITIRTFQDHRGKNILEFHDTGCGIAKKHMSHLFETFFTTKIHGVGLGLAFIKKVVEASRATILCESQTGQFTTFRFTFEPQPVSLKKEATPIKNFDNLAESLVKQKRAVYK